MAARLRRGESGVAGVRRILRDETKEALRAMAPGRPARGKAIHDARKRLKKARAALRLVRDVLGDDEYRHENAALRDAARPLSEVRDADVLIATLDALVRRRTPIERRVLQVMRRRLMTDRRALRRRSYDQDALGEARKQVRSARKRTARWPRRGGWSILGPGLARVYRAGREGCAAARRDASDENLHECRKQTKYLWHQLQLLECVHPGRMTRLQERAHALSDRLGDDHDLAILRDKLEAARAALPTGGLRRIEPMIEDRRAALQREAFRLAAQLYADPPSRFIGRVGTSWHAWRRAKRRRSRSHA